MCLWVYANMKFWKRNVGKKNFKTKILITNIYKSDTIFVIAACELSVTRLPHLSGICFIDDREILVQGLP